MTSPVYDENSDQYGQTRPLDAAPPGYYPPQTSPPMSGPPMSGYPMSGPPMSGPPMSGPPMSGPPMSGPPVTTPMPAQFMQPGAMQPYGPPAMYGAIPQPAYGYSVDPLTGQMMSDKSKVVAGLLQLLPGGLFTIGGIGRLYAGNVGLGVAQLVASFVGWVSFFCGFLLILPFFITFACWAWFVVDGIVMLAGRPVDGQGRPLRS